MVSPNTEMHFVNEFKNEITKICEYVSIGNERNCPIKYSVGKALTYLILECVKCMFEYHPTSNKKRASTFLCLQNVPTSFIQT